TSVFNTGLTYQSPGRIVCQAVRLKVAACRISEKGIPMFSQVQTPAVLVDIDVARRNIDRFQAYANQHGLKVRPHIKTHKLPAIAELQLDAGAVGVTCQKISEAAAMAQGSPRIDDILITYNI